MEIPTLFSRHAKYLGHFLESVVMILDLHFCKTAESTLITGNF
jgi:hypothetical protein